MEFAEQVKNFFPTKLTLQIYAIIMKLSKSAFPQYFKVPEFVQFRCSKCRFSTLQTSSVPWKKVQAEFHCV